MAGISLVFLLLAASAATTAGVPAPRPPAPGPGCIDARAVTEARHLDERAVLLRTPTARYRIALAEDCPPNHDEPLVALAPHGWVCGGAGERLRVGDQACAITRVAPLDERGWALALRQHARENPVPILAAVTVAGNRVRGKRRFAASPEYCVDPRRVRGWNVSGNDLVISTKPRPGSREASSYRLELGESCSAATIGTQLSLVSGMGIGWVCGNPGDMAIISESWETSQVGGGELASALNSGFAKRGCRIVAVYPD